MNILHLKYVAEVAKTKSLSRAAETLFVSQPNLSRIVREFEETLGITIFQRTPRGVSLTSEGKEFLEQGEKVLRQIQELETMYQRKDNGGLYFSVTVPLASYISTAFTQFVQELKDTTPLELHYHETGSYLAIEDLRGNDDHLGIIRVPLRFEEKFLRALEEKGMESRRLLQFSYQVLVSQDSPLAGKDTIKIEELQGAIEIARGDLYVPSVSLTQVQKQELVPKVEKRIFVHERASQFQILRTIPQTYMLVSPMPQELLEHYGLTEIPLAEKGWEYEDILIYKKNYIFSELDHFFLKKIEVEIQKLSL